MSAQETSAEAQNRALAAKGRMVSLVIAGTMVLWLLVQFWIGPMLELTARFVVLIDLMAMAALLWALIVSLQIRRARKAAQSDR